jgi:hypothetical protein
LEDDFNNRRDVLRKLAVLAAGGAALAPAATQAERPSEAVPPWLPGMHPGAPSSELFPIRTGEVGVVAPAWPYGHGLRYGIKTNGVDTTDEVLNWRDSIVGMGFIADDYGLLHPRCRAVLPAGVIRISKPRALLDLRDGPVLWGYTIEGEGVRLTTIVYDPPNPEPMLFASNRIFGLTVRNLYFTIPEKATIRPDWMLSESLGKQQWFTFENLAFDGNWRAGVRLSGVPGSGEPPDCNSEHKFDRIIIGANFEDAFLTDSDIPGLQSQQFLNYWMSNINMGGDGRLVRLRRGGHVTITNLDASGYKPPKETFLIDLTEVGNSDGCHSLVIRNARFEALSDGARFLRCRWERGNVVVDGYNDIVWRSTTRLSFEIRAGSAASVDSFGKFGEGASPAGAQYWFANGRFTGFHRFLCRGEAGSEAQNIPATIQYQNCEFCGPLGEPASRNIHSFVRFLADGDRPLINRPHVRFRSCRVEGAPNHVTDWDLGIQGAHASTTAPIKSLRFGTPQNGRLPSDGATSIMLPPGTLVLRVSWILPGGRAPEAKRPYRFVLTNGYEDATRRERLAIFEGQDFNDTASRVDLLAHDTAPWPQPADFDPVRAATLVLRETAGPGIHPLAQCIVEYI